ncbi:MAG: glucose-6-phosphate isomerase [Myxococcales bacterium]|nr:glucose-6-phosphate isomerase [Myxococcales bacterium]
MSSLDSPLLLHHPTGQVSIDATAMACSEADLDALPWTEAFDAMARLEAGDVANVDEGRRVGHYWLRSPERAPDPELAKAIRDVVEQVQRFASDVRSQRIMTPEGPPFTCVIHVGIGGSALGPQLLLDALALGDGLSVTFVDNTDADGIAVQLGRLEGALRHALVVVVSKSGTTAETMNGLSLVHEALRIRGIDAARHTVAVTQQGSALHGRAVREGWLLTLPMWDWVGGRTSVTSGVGLLPAALAAVDVEQLLAGARAMDTWTRGRDWRTNPAALLAGCWHQAGSGRGDRAMVVLPYADRLQLLSRYLQQLVMESLGKRLNLQGEVVHQGLTVYGNKGSTDQHAFVQQLRDGRDDFFVTFLQVLEDGLGSTLEVSAGATAGDFLQGFLLGTRRALSEAGRPSLTVTVPRVDAHHLGALVALFERAVGLYASLVGINAYHQPGVEAGKRAARSVLDMASALRAALSEEGRTADALAASVGADAVDAFHVLQRLASTGRASRQGTGPTARFAKP